MTTTTYILSYILIGILISYYYTVSNREQIKEETPDMFSSSFVEKAIFTATIFIWPYMLFCEVRHFISLKRYRFKIWYFHYKHRQGLLKILKRIRKREPNNKFINDEIKRVKNLNRVKMF